MTQWLKRFRSRLFAVGLVLPLSASMEAQGAQLRPVVGLWRANGDVLTTDGASWKGATAKADLDAVSHALFGQSVAAFATSGAAPGAFPLAVAIDVASFTAGTLRVEFRLESGPTDQSGGIVFDLAPNGSYRFVRYNTKDGNLALWGFVDGERQVIAKGDGLKQLPLGAWHTLVVRIDDRNLHAHVEGHPELTFAYTLDRAPSGRVGLWAKRDVVTSFRKFDAKPGTSHEHGRASLQP